MKLKLFGMMVLVGAAATACKVSIVDDATGGTGGTGSVTSSTKASATSTKAVTATAGANMSTGSGLACDTGDMTTIDSATCTSCIQCAVGDACSAQAATYQADPNAAAWEMCVFGDAQGMGGCAMGDTACQMACSNMYPGTEAKYLDVLSCAVCQECPNNCDAATNCM